MRTPLKEACVAPPPRPAADSPDQPTQSPAAIIPMILAPILGSDSRLPPSSSSPAMTTVTAIRQPEQIAARTGASSRADQLRWPLLLIAILTAYTGYMIRGSYYFADDFLTFGYADPLGLSWSLVFLNLFGHVAPTERYCTISRSRFRLSITPLPRRSSSLSMPR